MTQSTRQLLGPTLPLFTNCRGRVRPGLSIHGVPPRARSLTRPPTFPLRACSAMSAAARLATSTLGLAPPVEPRSLLAYFHIVSLHWEYLFVCSHQFSAYFWCFILRVYQLQWWFRVTLITFKCCHLRIVFSNQSK